MIFKGECMAEFNLDINTLNSTKQEISLREGQVLFVLGANGVGKSALMHSFYVQNTNQTKRVLAHRQTWLMDNTLNITAMNRRDTEAQIKNRDQHVQSRWRDDYTAQRTSNSLFDLISAENERNQRIAAAMDKNKTKEAKLESKNYGPLKILNELLANSSLPIEIFINQDQFLASKNGSPKFSIAELSDGERNALLICSDVLTTPPNHLIILDEPERHLHRAIISPLLTSLFLKRKDCVFIVSTHDIQLPIDHPKSTVLLLRSCQWNNSQVKNWDGDILPNMVDVPEDIKLDILGSKRKVLFVEGQYNSLDKKLYELLFPNITIIAQNNCADVMKAVAGIKDTPSLHWVSAYGLIDSDDRASRDKRSLLTKGIASLNCYSVESLYYNMAIIERVALNLSHNNQADGKVLFEKAKSKILSDFERHKIALCARLCEKKLRTKIMTGLPSRTKIAKGGMQNYSYNLSDILKNEEKKFETLIKRKNYNGLINRYPARTTSALTNIATGLGITRESYETIVRTLILTDKEVLKIFKILLKEVYKIIK